RARDFLPRVPRRIILVEPKHPPQQLEERKEGQEPSVRDAAGLVHSEATFPTAVAELTAKPALAGAGFGDDSDDLCLAVHGPCERSLENRHLVATAHEARQAAGSGDIKARTHAPHAVERKHAKRLCDPLQA